MPAIDLSILNQRQTPAFYADVFANRPAAGFVGRIFVSTNTFAFYRDNGTGWDLIGGPGTGTITGSGTAGTVPLWNGASTIGDSTLIEGSTKFTTTKDIQADAFYLNGMTAGSGALYWTSDRVTLANYNPTGTVEIEVAGGVAAQTINADLSTLFYGNIIRNGGTSSQFLKADGSLDSNTYNTGSGAASQVAFFSGTNAITGENNLWWDSVNNHFGINTNVPGTAADIHHDQSTILQLNQTVATNDTRIAFQNSGSALWRIGNFYNAGANDWGIFDVVGSIQPLTVKKTTGQVLIGTSTVGSGKLVVASASSDNGVQIVGASAPSLRIDNAESGPTKRAGLGISTATNNFIQGSADRDFCMFNGSTTPSPILFGVYGTTNVQEAARISSLGNFLVNTTVDNGKDFQVSGTGSVSSSFSMVAAQIGGPASYNEPSGTNGTLQFGNYTGGFLTGNIDNYIYKISGAIGNVSAQSLIFQTRSDVTGGGFAFIVGSTPAAALYINGSGNVGINRTNQEFTLDVNGDIALPRTSKLQFTGGTAGDRQRSYFMGNPNNDIGVYTPANNIIAMFHNSGNTLLGTTTDAGYKLQVNGTAFTSGTLTSTGNANTTAAIICENSNGASGTPQYYQEFKVGATTIARLFRGNSFVGAVGNGLNIDNFDGFQIRTNQLGGSGGTINLLGGNVLIGTNANGASILRIVGLPTSAAGLSSGDVYSNLGILTIVP